MCPSVVSALLQFGYVAPITRTLIIPLLPYIGVIVPAKCPKLHPLSFPKKRLKLYPWYLPFYLRFASSAFPYKSASHVGVLYQLVGRSSHNCLFVSFPLVLRPSLRLCILLLFILFSFCIYCVYLVALAPCLWP